MNDENELRFMTEYTPRTYKDIESIVCDADVPLKVREDTVKKYDEYLRNMHTYSEKNALIQANKDLNMMLNLKYNR